MNDGSAMRLSEPCASSRQASTQAIISSTVTPYGTLSYFTNDDPIGKALARYGEWAKFELDFLHYFLRDGDVAIDVGANVGTHTLAFARYVGSHGNVLAFEPQPAVFEVLQRNIDQNGLGNVRAYHAGVGAERSRLYVDNIDGSRPANLGAAALHRDASAQRIAVPVMSLDELRLDACHLVKVDAEGMEKDVLEGMRETIDRRRPVLFVECNAIADGLMVMQVLHKRGYLFHLVATAAYNPSNERACADNFFGVARESALACLPAEKVFNLPATTHHCRVDRIDTLEQFAMLHLAVPRYGDATEHDRDLPFLTRRIEELGARNEHLDASQASLHDKCMYLRNEVAHLREGEVRWKEEVERLTFRNKSLTSQLDGALATAQTLADKVRPEVVSVRAQMEVAASKASRSALRQWLSRFSARYVRDPLRVLRRSIRASWKH
jgi:FkbM family methyltransferase